MNAQPVISPARIITKEERGTIINGDQNVDCAIVIEISKRQTTRGHWQREKRTALGADVFERIAGAVKQDERLVIAALAVQGGNEVVRIAVSEKQIQISIVVVIKKLQAPAAHRSRSFGNSRGNSQVIEGAVMIVPVNGKILAIKIGHEQVLPAVLIEVSRVHAHPGTRPTIGAVGHAGFRSDLSEFSLSIVYKQKIGHGIVGDEEIHPTIVVDIGSHNAPGFSEAR